MKLPWIFQRRSVYDANIRRIHAEAHNKAITEIVELLRKKDKIYLDTVTIVGNARLDNCIVLGCDVGIKIIPLDREEER